MKIKRFFNITLIALIALLLNSCANFTGTDTSVWAGGLWVLPWLTGLGSAVFLALAYRSSKSGSTITTPTGEQESDENVPIYKIGTFWYGITCLIATILIIINVVSNK